MVNAALTRGVRDQIARRLYRDAWHFCPCLPALWWTAFNPFNRAGLKAVLIFRLWKETLFCPLLSAS